MKERFCGSDYRFIAVCLVLLAGTTWFSVRNFHRAFPEASIDFRVSREEALVLASRFLNSQGVRVDGFREASSFTFDDDAKTFLEREAGLEQANRIMGTRVRLWRWSYRWFRPQQKEEYRVDITPRGELAGWEHQLAEDAARPSIAAAQARALAESFLRVTMHRDPASLEFVEAADVTRPRRVDRVFTWKERAFRLHEATNRVAVVVLGDEVGGYREYLKVPERWTRDYERLRSRNEMAQTIDSAVMLVLAVGLVVVIVMRVRRQDVRWRRAAMIGLVGMGLSFCAGLNESPLREFGYPTTDSYGSFLGRQLLQEVLSALAAGGLLFVLAAGAESLYREAYPLKISLGNLFRPRGLRTRRFFLGATLGITLTGIFIAYQTGFYITANRFGAWSPADVPYTELLNTRFPWLFVLFGGYLPAVSEEFLFRMFGIPFLRKLVRSTALAVVLSGFIWGFGHAGYPQQPFFIRGLEVGIGGVALGLIMLRWGILPTLVWHYSVDAMYSAMLLIRSPNLYYRLSGIASAGIVVLPVVLALAAYWRYGGFESETGLLNADEAAPPEPVEPAPELVAASTVHRPLGTPRRLAAVALCAAGLLALLIPVSRFGESPRYLLSAAEARTAADSFLRSQGLDPSAYRAVTYPGVHWGGEDGLAGKYFLERRPVSMASALFERYRPVRHWVTRYFKSLDVDGVVVSVHPETGKVLGFGRTTAEDRPGADLPPDAARHVAESFAASQGRDVGAMDLKESRSEKKKARGDHNLVWEARAGDARNVDEARYRVEIQVAGDRVSSLRSYWKIPESFERGRSRQNWLSIALMVLRIGALSLVVVWVLWLLIQNTRRGLVPWGTALRVAVPAALLAMAGPLLSLDLMLRDYNTAVPLETYLAVMYTTVAMSLVFAVVLLGGSAALVTSFYPDCIGALRAAGRRRMGLDAGAALLAALGLGLLIARFRALLLDRFPAQALFSFGGADGVASHAPAVVVLAGAMRTAILDAAVLAALALLVRRLPKPWIVPVALVAAFAVLPAEIRTPGEFALQYAAALAMAGGVAVFCLCFARANYLAYALALSAAAVRPGIAELLGSGNGALRAQGWMVVGVAIAGAAWALLPALTREPVSGRD